MQQLMMMEMQPARKRDPNLDNPAVLMHREIIHLRANYLQREEIALTVGNVRVWEAVLLEWMLEGRNPKNVMGMLKVYREMVSGVGR